MPYATLNNKILISVTFLFLDDRFVEEEKDGI
jgi:hypothetical protein